MTASPNASLFTYPRFMALNTEGYPLAGGKLYSYQAGTLTPQATYTDTTLTVPNPNPIILDSFGTAAVWLSSNTYKFNLFDVNGVQQADFPIDNVTGYAQASAAGAATAVLADLASTAAGQGDNLLATLAPFAGAGPRTQHAKNTEFITVTDFYANGVSGALVDPTGAIDSTGGIQAALNCGGKVRVPAGTYKYSALTLSVAGTTLEGGGWGNTILNSNKAIPFQITASLAGNQLTVSVAAGTLVAGMAVQPVLSAATQWGYTNISSVTNGGVAPCVATLAGSPGNCASEIMGCYPASGTPNIWIQANNCAVRGIQLSFVNSPSYTLGYINGNTPNGDCSICVGWGSLGMGNNPGSTIIDGTLIENCELNSSLLHGIAVGCSTNTIVRSNYVADCLATAIIGEQCSFIDINDNVIINSRDESIYVEARTGATASFSGSVMTLQSAPVTGALQVGSRIIGTGVPVNTIIGSLNSGSWNAIGSTYNLSSTPGTIATTNIAFANNGIPVGFCQNVRIIGNTINGSNQGGIGLDTTCGFVILGNTINGTWNAPIIIDYNHTTAPFSYMAMRGVVQGNTIDQAFGNFGGSALHANDVYTTSGGNLAMVTAYTNDDDTTGQLVISGNTLNMAAAIPNSLAGYYYGIIATGRGLAVTDNILSGGINANAGAVAVRIGLTTTLTATDAIVSGNTAKNYYYGCQGVYATNLQIAGNNWNTGNTAHRFDNCTNPVVGVNSVVGYTNQVGQSGTSGLIQAPTETDSTWTPTFASYGGSVTTGSVVAKYKQVGNVVFFSVYIPGAAMTSTANSSNFTLPTGAAAPASGSAAFGAVDHINFASYGNGVIFGSQGKAYTPTWGSTSGVDVSGFYFTS